MKRFTTLWVVKMLIYEIKFFKMPFAVQKQFLCNQKTGLTLCLLTCVA